MKFKRSEDLYAFIDDKKLFDNIIGISELCNGGSSFNFRIKTATGDYLLKLISDNTERMNLIKILSLMGDYVPIKEEKFGDYYLLAMRFFVGHKPKYADFDSQLFAQIKELYANMQKIGNKTDIKVLSSQNNNIEKYVNAINNAFFDKSNNFVIRIINKLFWQRFKKDILHIAAGQEVIHGDLTVNNLLLNESGKIYLLDYGNLQYGYPLEDFVGLIMQLSGFSGIVGRCRHFIKLKKALQEAEIPLADEAQMWLYAVQMFYLKKLQRRFNGVRAKRNSLRKNLCLLLCLLQYFKLAKILQK